MSVQPISHINDDAELSELNAFERLFSKSSWRQKDDVLGVLWHDTEHMGGGSCYVCHNETIDFAHQFSALPKFPQSAVITDDLWAAIAVLRNVDGIDKRQLKKWQNEVSQRFFEAAAHSAEVTFNFERWIGAAFALLSVQNHAQNLAGLMAFANPQKMAEWKPFWLPLEENFLNTRLVLFQVAEDLRAGESPEKVATRLLQTLVQYISYLADYHSANHILLAGTAFKNKAFADFIQSNLSRFDCLVIAE